MTKAHDHDDAPVHDSGFGIVSEIASTLRLILGVLLAILFLLCLMAVKPAIAHEVSVNVGGHEHIVDYRKWKNMKGAGCCNNQDCRPVQKGERKFVNGQVFIKIFAKWCPVKPYHYVKEGNTVNVESVCISQAYEYYDECELLLCYEAGGMT